MTQPTEPTQPQPPQQIQTEQEEQDTEEALAAAFAAAAAVFLAGTAAAVLGVPGVPNLSLMGSGTLYVADALTRAAAALDRLWRGTPRQQFLPIYLDGLRYRLDGLQRAVWKKTNKALADAQAAHADVDQMRDDIRAALSPKLYGSFVERLARTEAAIAINSARDWEARQAAYAGATVTKTWRTRRDHRVRPTHKDAEGQTVPLDAPFIVGGWPMMYPADPAAPASEVVNCFPGWVRVSTSGVRVTWRRWYEGELITLHLTRGTPLDVTPNHPLLTGNGEFVAAKDLIAGDTLVRCERDSDTGWAFFDQLYQATSKLAIPRQSASNHADFHGDGTPETVTETIRINPTAHAATPAGLRRFGRALARQAATPAHPAVRTAGHTATLEEIIGITRRPYAGHVFNLDSGTGWYTANDIVAANCRCAATYDIRGGRR